MKPVSCETFSSRRRWTFIVTPSGVSNSVPDVRLVTIRITFEVPDSMMSFSEGSTHAREFKDVPKPVAQKIVADAVELAQPQTESAQKKVYRYRRVGASDQTSQEVMLPLDFEEVVGLSVTQQVRSDTKVP